jgi:hypothetical protein
MIAVGKPSGTIEPPQLEALPELQLLDSAPGPLEQASGPAERSDAEFPPHMLRWTVVGAIAYVAIIAAAMIYAALLSPAAIR